MSWNPLVARLAGGVAFALGALLAVPESADGQILRRIRETVKSTAEEETQRQVARVVRDKVKCVFDDLECIENARAGGEEPVLTDDAGQVLMDEEGQAVTDPGQAARIADRDGVMPKPGEGAWANYDFQPGDEILLFEDFSRDRVGDFPRRFELVQGSWEIVDWEGGRYLRATSPGLLAIPLPRTLPERFTIEYAVHLVHGNSYVNVMTGRAYHGPARNYRGSVVSTQLTRTGVRPSSNVGPMAMAQVDASVVRDGVAPVRIMADGNHMKVYLGERRVANVPNAIFPRSDSLFIAVGSAWETHPILIGPIRIAGGGLDLYDRLERDGRVATHGILFATNSDRIRPESTPTLQEIGTMLQQHGDLRIAIEGHTDSDGDEAYNQALSERRAAAVKVFLEERYGLAPDRLKSAGFGESRPVADNGTAEGKQQNRRVELVRLDG